MCIRPYLRSLSLADCPLQRKNFSIKTDCPWSTNEKCISFIKSYLVIILTFIN